MRFYATEGLGDHQALTPEGFLVCMNVPVARIGTLLYEPDEVPEVKPLDGVVRIIRDPEDVFNPRSIASFEGKPFIHLHPENEDVTPNNWKEHSVGHVQNVRRGEDNLSDCLVADIVVNDMNAIKLIRGGLRQISLGYDADYKQTAPGYGRQLNIIGNHVALVPQGRCGTRCAIQDKAPMAIQRKRLIADARATLDALEEMDGGGGGISSGGDTSDGETHVHLHLGGKDEAAGASGGEGGFVGGEEAGGEGGDINSRITALEEKLNDVLSLLKQVMDMEDDEGGGSEALEPGEGEGTSGSVGKGDISEEEPDPSQEKEETGDSAVRDYKHEKRGLRRILGHLGLMAPPGTNDSKEGNKLIGKRLTKDSIALESNWQDTMALAEILAPGVKLPTFDARLSPQQTTDRMCAFKRRVLDAAMQKDGSREIIETLNGGGLPNVGRMSCDAVSTLFVGAANMQKIANNAASTRRSVADGSDDGKIVTIADLNKRNREYWQKRGVA